MPMMGWIFVLGLESWRRASVREKYMKILAVLANENLQEIRQ